MGMKRFLRYAMLFSLTLGALKAPICSRAVTILSGPTFTNAANAPLAGVLQLTTDVESRVSVSVNDGTNVWERDFYDYAASHSVPLLGFKPGRTNEITVMIYDRRRNQFTAAQPLEFITDPLPAKFPRLVLLHSEPDKMEPGYTLFNVQPEKCAHQAKNVLRRLASTRESGIVTSRQ
jgi:hypothetical protein